MAKFYFPSNVPHIDFYHWWAASIAHNGALAGGRVLSGAVLESLMKPDLVEFGRRSFRNEIDAMPFKSMLPQDQQPSIDLIQAAMNKFKSLMRPHYVSRRPLFR